MLYRTKPTFRRLKYSAASVVGILAITLANSAYANGIETVTVTASKRKTNLQTTPLAIDVVTGSELNAAQINTTSALQFQVPSFVMSTNVIQGEVYIRGIGTDISSIAADPSVAVMVDGIYQPRLSSSLQDLYDVARVEVLKGPQGTLYGRNATGGVINIITKPPSDTFGLDADVLYGSYNDQRYRVSVTGPLNKYISGRLSVIHHTRDGYVKNLYLGGTVDPLNTWAGRGSLRIQPSSAVDITLRADYSADKGAPASAINVLSKDAPALFFGGTVTNNPYAIYENLRNKVNNEQYGFSGTLSWKVGTSIFKSITAYQHSKFNLILDLDGTQVNWFIHDPDLQSSNTFSQEFRLASDQAGPINWLLGAYYFHEYATSSYNLFLPLFSVNVNPIADLHTNAYALYGEATYHLTSKLGATFGIRYSDEHKQTRVLEESYGAVTGSFAGSKGWNALTPKLSIKYTPSSNMMLYASATRGFKSGGFNSTAIQTPQSFNPEFVWSYETGVKSTFWDDRALFDADAFYYDYSNLQVNKYDSVNIVSIENAARATIKGFEVKSEIMPVSALTLSANLSVLDATYDKFQTVNPDNPGLGPVSLKGNMLVRAPKFSANVGAQYEIPLEAMGSLTLRANYFYRSRIYFTPFNDPKVSQGGFGLWNMSVEFDNSDGRWSISAFVKNLTNQLYYQEESRSASIVGTIGWPGTPRTFGIDLAVHM